MSFKSLLAALVVSLCLAAPVLAGPLEDADVAYERGDYATASRLWRPLAEQGFANAQHSLGVMYDDGHGVAQDYKEAVKWYRLAAEQDFGQAQNNLGFMYANGLGVTQDDKEVVKWYRLAAEQGFAQAQYNLGFMYAKGRGVEQDYARGRCHGN